MENRNASAHAVIFGAVVLTYVLMVMGTFVTSTGSGLACPDWPLCYGSVRPPLRLDIWFEWGHRLLGGLTSVLIILATILVWRNHRGAPRFFTGAVMALLVFSIGMGGVVVLTEAPYLDTLPRVLIVSSHLILSTLVLIFLAFTLSSVSTSSDDGNREKGLYPLLFGAVLVQAFLGIFVRYSGASLACPDLPLCHGLLVPALGSTPVALHFFHRALAVFVLIVSAAALYRGVRSGTASTGLYVTVALVLVQTTAGVFIVYTGMFFPLLITHGALGFALVGLLAYLSMPFIFKVRSPVMDAGEDAPCA